MCVRRDVCEEGCVRGGMYVRRDVCEEGCM